jgi:replicative DNA helicase
MVTSNEILASLFERYDSISGKISFADFISSGLHSLDERLAGGFQKGKIYVFTGPDSVGKTSLAISIIGYIICHYSAYQKRILFSSYSPA